MLLDWALVFYGFFLLFLVSLCFLSKDINVITSFLSLFPRFPECCPAFPAGIDLYPSWTIRVNYGNQFSPL